LVGIGIWTVFAMIPVGILFGVGLSVRGSDATLGAALIAIAVGAILLVSAVSLATRQVFSVALYRYANGVPDTKGFSVTDLEEPFRRRGGRG
jgi:fucose permease